MENKSEILNKESIKDLLGYNENGDVKEIEEVRILQSIQKRHFKKGEFYTMNKKVNTKLKDKKYTGETYRLFFTLLEKIDYNNRIKSFTQTSLGNELGISQSNVSKGLKILKNDGLIYKDGRDWYFSDEYVKYAGDN